MFRTTIEILVLLVSYGKRNAGAGGERDVGVLCCEGGPD